MKKNKKRDGTEIDDFKNTLAMHEFLLANEDEIIEELDRLEEERGHRNGDEKTLE